MLIQIQTSPWQPAFQHYFEVGIILRNSLLLSSMLFNAEAWYNVSNSELDLLETIDVMMLRKLLKTPKYTPKEMLFLELGCVPMRDLIKEKRLNFLYYILKEDPESLVHKFFQAQLKNMNKKDWVATVLEDLKELDLENLSMVDISNMKKGSFRNLINEKIKIKAFERLQKIKLSHSKVENVEHSGIIMQKYLQPSSEKMTREESQIIFKLRCRATNIKVNMKGKYDNFECGACGQDEESQQHILDCPELNKMEKYEKIKYEKLFNGTVADKIKIARRFKENFDILENLKK